MNKWEQEPNFKQGEHLGLNWHILRSSTMGHLCGYVEVPKENKIYGIEDYSGFDFDVHGGITYAEFTEDKTKFVIGFDCAHLGDIAPMLVKKMGIYAEGTYRSIEYVQEEIFKLIKQLKEM